MVDYAHITIDGEEHSVRIKEVSQIDRMRYSYLVGHYFAEEVRSGEIGMLSETQIEFCQSMVAHFTPLDKETIMYLPMKQFVTLIDACFRRIGGLPIEEPEEDESVFDFNDNGTVDLDDWR